MHGLPPGQFRFVPVSELGSGGLGHVDEIEIVASGAASKTIGSRWARKRLNARWNSHPDVRKRFEREISALKRMTHQNIVTYEGENLAGEERFYMMPVYSATLRKLIAGNTKQGDWRFAAEHGAILAGALSYAHGEGFIHRDLKPDNILFNHQGPLIIADWGLGYFVHRESKVLVQLTRGGMGTEYYCSLEQWNTGKCDERGDIYSLGMTLDELVTGTQRSITVGMGVRQPSVAPSSEGARRFNGLLQKMTEPLASSRPSNMGLVAEALRNALRLG